MPHLTSSELEIIDIEIWPLDIAVTDDFVISRGKVSTAEIAFVEMTLRCGATGYGEIAPFTDVTGEDRQTSSEVAVQLGQLLVGESVSRYGRLSYAMAEANPTQPAARCGLETAMLDALCRAIGIPLWAFWGGAFSSSPETDITLPLIEIGRCLELANHWFNSGFRTFKLKVGSNLEQDIERIRLISERFPQVSFILDANEGFTEDEALRFMREVLRLNCKVLLFEQPVARSDLAGLAAISTSINVPVAADESVATVKDALAVIEAKAAGVINLKIMKSGVLEAFRIATIARSHGIGLMFGGMVETRLAMGCSLSLALGLGGAKHLDLDTPLLLSEDPLEGGYQYEGPRMTICQEPGLGSIPATRPSDGEGVHRSTPQPRNSH